MSLVVTEMYAVNCFVIPFENESTTTLFNSVPHLLNEKYYNRKRKLMTKRYQTEVLALFYIMKGWNNIVAPGIVYGEMEKHFMIEYMRWL